MDYQEKIFKEIIEGKKDLEDIVEELGRILDTIEELGYILDYIKETIIHEINAIYNLYADTYRG